RKPMAKSEVRTHTTKCGAAAALQASAKLFGVLQANQAQCERILVNLGAVENVKVGSPHGGRGDCGPTCFARSHPNFPPPSNNPALTGSAGRDAQRLLRRNSDDETTGE